MSSGILYTAISKYSSVFVSIFIGAVLARLLTPSEFGTVAIVMVFISFFNLLSNFGLGPAVVQFKNLTEEDIQSIFSFSIIIGITLALLFFLSAPLIAYFYNDDKLINLSRLMSLAIIFHTAQVIPNALNLKKLRFKKIGIISVTVHLISGIIAIILAYFGFSYYSLILHSIFSGLFLFIAYYYLEPIRIVFRIEKSSIRKIAKFSTFQFFFNFINYFSRNTDNLLIGKFFGASALGFYDKAYRLMMMPVQNLTHVITPVLHPVLSEYQNDTETIINAYYKLIKLLATVAFPLSIFLFFSSSEIIYIIYGPQWEESIPVFKLLALTVSIQIILSSTGSIFQSTNRTDLLFYAGLFGAILLIGGITIGVFLGGDLISVGYGLIIAFILNFFQALYLLIVKALKSSYVNFLKLFVFPIFSGLLLAIFLWFFESLFIKEKILSLSLKFFISAILVLSLFSISKENRELVKHYIKHKKLPPSDN